MNPVPIPENLIPPSEIKHRVAVVGPSDIDDLDKFPPVETLIMEDGYHVRVAVTNEDMIRLMLNPHIHIVFRGKELPPFWIGSEDEAIELGNKRQRRRRRGRD